MAGTSSSRTSSAQPASGLSSAFSDSSESCSRHLIVCSSEHPFSKFPPPEIACSFQPLPSRFQPPANRHKVPFKRTSNSLKTNESGTR